MDDMATTPLKLMIIVGSVRPGRLGLPIAEWVRGSAEAHGGFEIDFVDLADLALPFMDEPNHPAMHQYTKPHTIAWGERVAAANAFIFVTPEYNHSFSPSLKNAIDFLLKEWWRKSVGFVSYGGVSGGTRGVESLMAVVANLGMVRVGANVELPFAKAQLVDGAFVANEKESAVLERMFGELVQESAVLQPLQNQF
jgi:NAD(P)H-dependent FMN reductase